MNLAGQTHEAACDMPIVFQGGIAKQSVCDDSKGSQLPKWTSRVPASLTGRDRQSVCLIAHLMVCGRGLKTPVLHLHFPFRMRPT